MPIRRAVAVLAALAAAPALAQEPAPAGGVPLAPHRAIYDLTLVGTGATRAFDDARGRLAFDFSGDSCDGWSVNYRQVTQLQSGETGQTTLDTSGASFETPGGRSLRFRIENRGRGAPTVVEGEAERQPDDTVQVRLRRPKPDTLRMSGPILFTTAHTEAILVAARAGRNTLSARIYDGGDDGRKVYETLAVVGPRIEPGAGAGLEEPARHEALGGLARWPVKVSYFLGGAGDSTPIQVISFELYENGVSRALVFDYGSFALKGELVAFTPTGTGTCNR